MAMATVAGIVGLGFAALLGLPFVVGSVLQVRTSLGIRGTDWQDVIDINGDYAKIQAQAATADGTVTAPFSGREWLAVEAAIQQYQTSEHRNGWLDDHVVTESVPFDIEDPTGSVRVEPDGADWSLGNDYEHLVESGEAPTGPHAAFVADNDVYTFDDEGVAEAHEVKFVERRAEPGDEIAVFGPYDGGGVDRRIRADDGRVVSKLFSIADDRDELTQTVGTGLISLLFGLGFLAAGLGFAWLGFT